MDKVQVRMEVSKVTSANVSYLSKRLGLPKKETYALIVEFFLYERDLISIFIKLEQYRIVGGPFTSGTEPDDIPF